MLKGNNLKKSKNNNNNGTEKAEKVEKISKGSFIFQESFVVACCVDPQSTKISRHQ